MKVDTIIEATVGEINKVPTVDQNDLNSESQRHTANLVCVWGGVHEATSHQVMGIWLVYSSALKVPMEVVKVAMDMVVAV